MEAEGLERASSRCQVSTTTCARPYTRSRQPPPFWRHFRSKATVSNGCSRGFSRRIHSTEARPRRSVGRSMRPLRGSDATPGATERSSARSCVAGQTSAQRRWARLSGLTQGWCRRPVRSTGRAVEYPRRPTVPDERGASAHRRDGCPRQRTPRAGLHVGRRPHPDAGWTRCRVAVRRHGLASDLSGAWLPPAFPRRPDRDRASSDPAAGSAHRSSDPVRHLGMDDGRDLRRRAPQPLPGVAGSIQSRAGRVQARLGSERADPMVRGRLRRRRHAPPGWGARRSRFGRACGRGRNTPGTPFVLLAQPSLFDATRAPRDRHTAWAYCHVPNGSRVDMTERIEMQVERFAPGFRDVILERHKMTTADLEAYNAAYAGGDISAGGITPRQLLARPSLRLDPYRTPAGSIYLCSASTPPGPGVHGMCGLHGARSALRNSLR